MPNGPQLSSWEPNACTAGNFFWKCQSLVGYLGLEVMGPAEKWQPESALSERDLRKKLNFLKIPPKLSTQRKIVFVFVKLKAETSGIGDPTWICYETFLRSLL